jgi:uncharacterized protein with HEPN domain
MPRDDRARLEDMIDHARSAIEFVAGRQQRDLETDLMLTMALTRAIEVVSEAAAGVSSEAKANAPDIPWTNIVGMRHRLIHAYADIDRTILWKTATEELPDLVARLQTLIADS